MSLLPSSPDVTPDSDPRLVGLDSEEADELMAALSSETARRLLAELHEDPAPPGELAERVDTSLQNAQYHLEKLEGAGAIEVVGTAYSEKGREMAVYGPADSPLVIYAGEQERASGLRAALTRLFTGILALAVGSLAIQELFGRSIIRQVGDQAAPGAGTEPTPTPTEEAADAGTGNGADGAGGGDAAATPTDEPTPTAVDEEGNATTRDAGDATATSDATGTPIETETPAATAEPAEATATEAATTEAAADTPAPTDTPVPTATEGGGAGPLDVLDGLVEGLVGGGLPPGLAFFVGGLTVLVVVVSMTYVRAQP